MGNMNLFTRFPNDVNGKGLINPYIFAIHAFNKKLSVRSDFNLFFNQYPLNPPAGQNLNKYLGFENDLSVKYKPNKKWEINYGFSWLIPQKEIGLLRKVRDTDKAAVWSYLMISYRFNVIDL